MYVDNEHNTALVVAAQGGDLRARDRLVAAWLPLVYNIVGRALNGHADVDDVVQETMLCAVSGLDGLRDPERFRSWLVAIAINQVRRRHARRATTTPLDEIAEYPDPTADFADLTILRLGLSGQRRDVAEATRWLDPDTRELLALWWLEAGGTLTRAELAAALDLPATHVAVRVQRMKEQLEAARVVVRALAADPRCAQATTLLATWDGRPTPLWRKRISRHARACGACGAHRYGLAPVEGLLAGLALLPPTAVLLHLLARGPWSASGATTVLADPSAVAHAGPMGGPDPTSGPGSMSGPGPLGEASSMSGPGPAMDPGPGGAPGPPDDPGPAGVTDSAAAPPTADSAPSGHAAPRPARRPRRLATGAAAIGLVVLAAVVIVVRPHHDPPTRSTPAAKPPVADAASAPSVSPATEPPPATAPSTAPPPSTEPAATRSTASADPRPRLERAVVDLVNAARAEHGCAPVRVDDRLRSAARKHSDDMLARRFYDHLNPDGVRADGRITAAGYRWRQWGENLDRGRSDASHVVAQWLASPIHRDNILDCGYTDIGVGATVGPGGTTWWTQVFATPA
ncbi:sigma-70 family RNA polymerase sigma factor [Embleya scabrispora]|uniref:sigma-70 family RNA polymerase sigma factor n=1 Tax=Embleya scabrispora TaxID=159449 RepID=UPI00037B1F22|nr:sigma-70 family RNA polymerase sigma factor [Embleya scabrispora]MYS81476.1 sigma-70 family RNA polymerase sigma factor [Streptomyces sp. SID5474]